LNDILKRPIWKHVFVGGELGCVVGYEVAVFVEERGAVGGADAVD